MKRLLFLITAICLYAGDGYVISLQKNSGVVLNKKILYKSYDAIKKEGLEYLNYLRQKVDLIPLKMNDILSVSAYNHAHYCVINNVLGHYENSSYPGYTGDTPSQRAVYAGYKSRNVSENISYGNSDINDSIDGLFSAIYHRFGFLNTAINEIGIGYDVGSLSAYVYNMGNSYQNTVCKAEKYEIAGYYYTGVCANESLKVPFDLWNKSEENISKLNPKIILWPYENADKIPPVFYEESPDPLPEYDVSGYPVSVKFNKYYYTSPPKMLDFKLFDEEGNEIENVKILDKESDPNSKFDEYEFALFPLERLDWGKKYKVMFNYIDNDTNETESIEWSFKTKNLQYPYYKVETDYAELKVKSAKKYAVYLKPLDSNDVLTSMSSSYSAKNIFIDWIDNNTIAVEINGSEGDYAEISFNDGRKIKLIVSETDEAQQPYIPENNTSEDESNVSENNDTDGSVYKYVDTLPNGWHLLGTSKTIFNLEEFNVSVIWSYKDGDWYAYTKNESLKEKLNEYNISILDKIEANQGFWIYK